MLVNKNREYGMLSPKSLNGQPGSIHLHAVEVATVVDCTFKARRDKPFACRAACLNSSLIMSRARLAIRPLAEGLRLGRGGGPESVGNGHH